MMASMGAVNESTVVVTVVHDCQVGLHIQFDLTEQFKCFMDLVLE